jgi:hypothetical protein
MHDCMQPTLAALQGLLAVAHVTHSVIHSFITRACSAELHPSTAHFMGKVRSGLQYRRQLRDCMAQVRPGVQAPS